MGVKKALECEGLNGRMPFYAGGDVYQNTAAMEPMWYALYEEVNTALMKSDEALAESGLDEFHSLGYQTKYEEIKNEFDKMSQFVKYIVSLEEELYRGVDADFAKALIEPGSGALSLLSNIKVDDIQIKNNGLVEIEMCYADMNGHVTPNQGTYAPKTIGFDAFIGYNDNAGEKSAYVMGFTDVLYAPKLLEGQTIEGYLRDHEEEFRALFYDTDFRIERPGLKCLSNILDAITFGITAIVRGATGYNFVTKETLSDADQMMSGVNGIIILGGSVLAVGYSGASIVYIWVANGVEVVATETTQLICKELGLSPEVTMGLTILAGIVAEGGMLALLTKMNGNTVKLTDDALEAIRASDELSNVNSNQLDEIVEAYQTSYAQSSSNSKISQILVNRTELTGTNRERLLSTVQDSKLATYIDEIYRPGATVGDGGTADKLIDEFYKGESRHLIKAKGRLTEINKLINSGTLGLNDLDIAEALRDDLEYAIKLFD